MTGGPSQAAEKPGDIAVFTLTGMLDAEAAQGLLGTLSEAAARQAVALDLAGVTDADSDGLGALVRVLKAARDAGHPLALIGPRGELARLLGTTGLDQLFSIYPDLATASAHLAETGGNIPGV